MKIGEHREPKYNSNDDVICIRPGDVCDRKRGIVRELRGSYSQRFTYLVSVDGKEDNFYEEELMPAIETTNIFKRMEAGLYSRYEDFFRLNTMFKIGSINDNTISTLKSSKTLFQIHQYKPLLKFLNSDNQRILIADEVGLGKTIEAGHIMMEQYCRKQFDRVLIITPAGSLLNKWQCELEEKFNFYFDICQSGNDLMKALKADKEFHYLISYGKVGLNKRERDEKGNKQKKDIFEYLENEPIVNDFDLVICDEAHRVRNSNTERAKGVSVILQHAKAVLFLTATPIMTKSTNLFTLLRFLDKENYDTELSFDVDIAFNKPIISASNKLENKKISLQRIADELENATIKIPHQYSANKIVKDYYANNKMYQEIIRKLRGQRDTERNRIDILHDLSALNSLNSIFTRTRKKQVDVDGLRPTRDPYLIPITLEEKEAEFYEQEVGEQEKLDKAMGTGSLGFISKRRQYASCVFGNLNTDDDLDKGIDRFEKYPDAKINYLLQIIEHVILEDKKKLIIFAIFKRTIKYLKIRLEKSLAKYGFSIAIINGSIKTEDRYNVIEQFRVNEKIPILLASEVGSEGIDLQFCDTIVNYDLPWNPMVVEQRIGRIDRLGQKSPSIKIFNFVVQNSIAERIYFNLLDKINIFKNCIGDLEAILGIDFDGTNDENGDVECSNIDDYDGQTINDMFKDFGQLCDTALTERQLQQKADAIALAFAQRQRDVETVSSELEETISSDAYFRNEIMRICKNRSYITEEELYRFFESIINLKFRAGCNLTETKHGIYKLDIHPNMFDEVYKFVKLYTPQNKNDQKRLLNDFLSKLKRNDPVYLTFNQEIAFENKGLNYVNMFHPLIIAALNYYSNQDDSLSNTFFFHIPIGQMPDGLKEKSNYILAIYKISFTSNLITNQKNKEFLYPVLYDISKEVMLDEETADDLFGVAQMYADFANEIPSLSKDESFNIEMSITDFISKQYKNLLEDQIRRMDAYIDRRIQKTIIRTEKEIRQREESMEERNFKMLLESDPDKVNRIQSQLKGDKTYIENRKINMEKEIQEIRSMSVVGSKEPCSLNYIIVN